MKDTSTSSNKTPLQQIASELEEIIYRQMPDSLGDYHTRHFLSMVNSRLDSEKKMIIDAIMYVLDEDGHTGDWKIKFANDYYEKKFKK
jgi:hypothetical protein